MSKYLLEISKDHHEHEINLGIDFGYSKKWGFLRISISLFTYTINFTIDWKVENV